jgi:GAF domain-containing protein
MQPHQAFEEMAATPLEGISLADMMGKIARLTQAVLPGADEVSVTLIERGDPTTVAFTGPLAVALDERQYELGRGPCLDSIQAGQPVRISCTGSEKRWREWAEHAASQGCGSSLSVPVPLQREVLAALNIYSTREDAFDDASAELGITFAAYAAVTLANKHLYDAQGRVVEQLQDAMRSRAVIEQAKGIIMGERRCTSDEAFEALVSMSQDANRKLRDVAQALVDETGGWTARPVSG